MTVELLEALAADLLEYKDLVCLGLIVQDGGLDYCALYIGSSYLHGLPVCDEEDLAELYISTFGIGEPLHKDFVTSFYLKLLACNVYDCVHQTILLNVWTVSVCALAALNLLIGHKMDRKDSKKYPSSK